MKPEYLVIIENATKLLTQANIAVPIAFGLISGLITTLKGVTGDPTGPTLLEIAAEMETHLDTNDTAIKGDITRLKALLA